MTMLIQSSKKAQDIARRKRAWQNFWKYAAHHQRMIWTSVALGVTSTVCLFVLAWAVLPWARPTHMNAQDCSSAALAVRDQAAAASKALGAQVQEEELPLSLKLSTTLTLNP